MNHIGHSTQPIYKAVAHLIVACKTASLRVDPQAPILILEGDEIDVELMVISLVDVAHIALDALVLRAEPQYTPFLILHPNTSAAVHIQVIEPVTANQIGSGGVVYLGVSETFVIPHKTICLCGDNQRIGITRHDIGDRRMDACIDTLKTLSARRETPEDTRFRAEPEVLAIEESDQKTVLFVGTSGREDAALLSHQRLQAFSSAGPKRSVGVEQAIDIAVKGELGWLRFKKSRT